MRNKGHAKQEHFLVISTFSHTYTHTCPFPHVDAPLYWHGKRIIQLCQVLCSLPIALTVSFITLSVYIASSNHVYRYIFHCRSIQLCTILWNTTNNHHTTGTHCQSPFQSLLLQWILHLDIPNESTRLHVFVVRHYFQERICDRDGPQAFPTIWPLPIARILQLDQMIACMLVAFKTVDKMFHLWRTDGCSFELHRGCIKSIL